MFSENPGTLYNLDRVAEDGRDRAPDLRGAEGGHPEADPGPGAGRAEAACLLQLWEAEPIKFMTSDVSETSGVNKIFANPPMSLV